MEWLEVSNFAIDRRFIISAQKASSIRELRSSISNDEFFGIAANYCDALPLPDRSEAQAVGTLESLYGSGDMEKVRDAINDLDIALNVVRDIMFLVDVRYIDKKFVEKIRYSSMRIAHNAIFDWPNFIPFRYAAVIISGATAEFCSAERQSDEGVLNNYIKFKTIDRISIPERRSISLQSYVDECSRSK